jgi:hypothetical protein
VCPWIWLLNCATLWGRLPRSKFRTPWLVVLLSDGMTIARASKVQEGGLMTVDFLLVNPNLQAVFDGRSSRMLGDMPLFVVSREGLIQMKLQAGRPQDQMDVIKLTEMDR